LLIVVALIPMIRLVRPTVNPLVASGIYALAVLFAIGTIRQTFTVVQVISQTMLVVETFMGIAVLLWLRQGRKSTGQMAESSSLIALTLGGYLLFSVLVIALVAGAVGYTRLARLLTPGIIVGGILALAVFAYLRVVGGIVALAFRVWPLARLKMVQHHRALLEKRVYRLLAWMAVIGWFIRYLNYLGLLDPVWSFAQSMLAAKLERGTISISVGSTIEFFLTVWVAYLLSAFIRFALQEDVYPRINITPGLSYAASSLLNYVILALGFVAGLGVLVQGEPPCRRLRHRHRLWAAEYRE
jgi:potassium efflux system protein